MKKTSSLVFVLFLIIASAVFLKSSAHTKIHKNAVYFKGNGKFSFNGVTFTMQKHCISPGQPFSSKTLDYAQNHVSDTLTVQAGRHGSKIAAQCFGNLINNAVIRNTFTKMPHKLNFAIEGTLKLFYGNNQTASFNHIVLAQGHYGAINNWWLAGTNCLALNGLGSEISCPDNHGFKWCFFRGTHSFWGTRPNEVLVQHNNCA